MSGRQRPVRAWLVLCLAVALLAAAQVGVAHERLEMASQFNALQRDVRQAGDEINRMNIELTMLTRPERLRSVAIEQLGMRPPTAMQVVNP